ncbi:FMN-dependent NADH-azoreductase [Mucilaginibacter pallidiroseus]|uniref:FMN dependent NADH:quinone oxidoreductase n=1 Tax=Mucilaginibacter pallidiroseus TaxID=2599295 RepID=A0A563UID4_9SPHI|nr:FMN-dependent NADH-azoreductase [Mucilaginibacter pallidiroseus]TWR31049.1 FMN-dependent NADH-azoreductase [Mucilaginibacter pallidiroseus]
MKILHLISSPRGEASVSIKLGNAIVDKLAAANPGSDVVVRNLVDQPFPHLEEAHINSFFTPAENYTPELAEAVKHSDQAIAQIMDADVIVIGAPMYNFAIHSSLKAWIDHIARAQKTFTYTENGPQGLVKGKKVYVAISSGGIYSEGDYKPYDFTEPYLRAVLGFLGMTDITVYRAEGLKVAGVGETALEKAIESIAV